VLHLARYRPQSGGKREQRNRLRPWRPPQQSANRPCLFFSLASFGRLSNLATSEPDGTAAERRSISASRNALAANVILKAARASRPQNCESFLRLIFDHIGGDWGSVYATGHTALTRFFKSELTEPAGVTAIRALRTRKDQLQVGHTIHPSDSGRQASERHPCCHKESVAAYL
jgi:hypothetical protein